MAQNVFFAWMGKDGTNKQVNVIVLKEQSGMEDSVLLFKSVMEVWFGSKIHGLVNVPQAMCFLDLIVLRIHAKVDKFGIT